MKALRVSRVKAVLLHNLSASWGGWPTLLTGHFTAGNWVRYPFHKSMGWFQGHFGTFAENLATTAFRSWRLKTIVVTFSTFIIFRRELRASHRRQIGDCSLSTWLLILKIPNECVKIVREKCGVYSIKYKCLCNDKTVYHISQSNWYLLREQYEANKQTNKLCLQKYDFFILT